MLKDSIARDLEDIIKNHEINVNMLRDICFTVVMADNLSGSNQKEMSIDKFVSAKSKQWEDVLGVLNIEKGKSGADELPDVQKMRVLCDALTIATKGQQDTKLLSEVSNEVAGVLGMRLNAGEYHDIDDCYKVFEVFKCAKITDDSWIKALDKTLGVLAEILEIYVEGVSLKECLSDITVPVKGLHFFKEGACDNVDDFEGYIGDNVIYRIECLFATKFKALFKKDAVKCNSRINTIRREGLDCVFGTVSIGNYTPMLEMRDDLPMYMRSKIEKLFLDTKNYNINDLANIIFCLCILVGNKKVFSLKEATALLENKMKGR